jgi:hypothetical protein
MSIIATQGASTSNSIILGGTLSGAQLQSTVLGNINYARVMYPSINVNNTSLDILNEHGLPIVTVNSDGETIWHNKIDIDEAADALGKSLYLSAELKSGITETSKRKMRDSIFEDLISIAKEKGSLTAEDLTYLLSASKIVEKLKT